MISELSNLGIPYFQTNPNVFPSCRVTPAHYRQIITTQGGEITPVVPRGLLPTSEKSSNILSMNVLNHVNSRVYLSHKSVSIVYHVYLFSIIKFKFIDTGCYTVSWCIVYIKLWSQYSCASFPNHIFLSVSIMMKYQCLLVCGKFYFGNPSFIDGKNHGFPVEIFPLVSNPLMIVQTDLNLQNLQGDRLEKPTGPTGLTLWWSDGQGNFMPKLAGIFKVITRHTSILTFFKRQWSLDFTWFSNWWFGTFFICHNIWDNHPNCFHRYTTNQTWFYID